MKNRTASIVLAFLVACLLTLSGAMAVAKNSKEKSSSGQAKKQGASGSTETVVVTVPAHETSRTPPGWEHGKKTGWHGGAYPPGWSKWNKEKQTKWVGDRDNAVEAIDKVSASYQIPTAKQNEITRAFDQAIAGGLIINDAKDKLVQALKDEKSRKNLMIDTTQSVLELLK